MKREKLQRIIEFKVIVIKTLHFGSQVKLKTIKKTTKQQKLDYMIDIKKQRFSSKELPNNKNERNYKH